MEALEPRILLSASPFDVDDLGLISDAITAYKTDLNGQVASAGAFSDSGLGTTVDGILASELSVFNASLDGFKATVNAAGSWSALDQADDSYSGISLVASDITGEITLQFMSGAFELSSSVQSVLDQIAADTAEINTGSIPGSVPNGSIGIACVYDYEAQWDLVSGAGAAGTGSWTNVSVEAGIEGSTTPTPATTVPSYLEFVETSVVSAAAYSLSASQYIYTSDAVSNIPGAIVAPTNPGAVSWTASYTDSGYSLTNPGDKSVVTVTSALSTSGPATTVNEGGAAEFDSATFLINFRSNFRDFMDVIDSVNIELFTDDSVTPSEDVDVLTLLGLGGLVTQVEGIANNLSNLYGLEDTLESTLDGFLPFLEDGTTRIGSFDVTLEYVAPDPGNSVTEAFNVGLAFNIAVQNHDSTSIADYLNSAAGISATQLGGSTDLGSFGDISTVLSNVEILFDASLTASIQFAVDLGDVPATFGQVSMLGHVPAGEDPATPAGGTYFEVTAKGIVVFSDAEISLSVGTTGGFQLGAFAKNGYAAFGETGLIDATGLTQDFSAALNGANSRDFLGALDPAKFLVPLDADTVLNGASSLTFTPVITLGAAVVLPAYFPVEALPLGGFDSLEDLTLQTPDGMGGSTDATDDDGAIISLKDHPLNSIVGSLSYTYADGGGTFSANYYVPDVSASSYLNSPAALKFALDSIIDGIGDDDLLADVAAVPGIGSPISSALERIRATLTDVGAMIDEATTESPNNPEPATTNLEILQWCLFKLFSDDVGGSYLLQSDGVTAVTTWREVPFDSGLEKDVVVNASTGATANKMWARLEVHLQRSFVIAGGSVDLKNFLAHSDGGFAIDFEGVLSAEVTATLTANTGLYVQAWYGLPGSVDPEIDTANKLELLAATDENGLSVGVNEFEASFDVAISTPNTLRMLFGGTGFGASVDLPNFNITTTVGFDIGDLDIIVMSTGPVPPNQFNEWAISGLFSFDANAVISLGGVTPSSAEASSSLLPKIDFNMALNFRASVVKAAGAPLAVTWGAQFDISETYLDTGSFIKQFIAPIADPIFDMLEPVRPVIEILTAEIDLLSQMAPSLDADGDTKVTLLEAMSAAGGASDKATKVTNALNGIVSLFNILDAIPRDGSTYSIPLGIGANVEFGDWAAVADLCPPPPPIGPLPGGPGSNPGGSGNSKAEKFMQGLSGVANGLGALLTDGSTPIEWLTIDFLAVGQGSSNLLYGLLFGNGSLVPHPITGQFDIYDIVTVDIPEVIFQGGLNVKFPIFSFASLTLGGSVSFGFDYAIKYDTYGISKFMDTISGSPALETPWYDPSETGAWELQKVLYLAEGILIGEQTPITLSANVYATLAAGISGIIEVGVTGGIQADVAFTMNLWSDSPVMAAGERPVYTIGVGYDTADEHVEDLNGTATFFCRISDWNYMAPFDIQGGLSFYLDIFIWIGLDLGWLGKITLVDETFRLVEIELLSFNYSAPDQNRPAYVPPPVAEAISDNTQTQAVVSLTNYDAYYIFASDTAGQVRVTTDSNTVDVNGNPWLIPQSSQIQFRSANMGTFAGKPVKIYVESDVAADLNFIGTGDGDAVFYAGSGQATLLGMDGNDTLYGGSGGDSIDGGLGDDLIDADMGVRAYNSAADRNSLYGGGGSDTIYGSVNKDDLHAGGGSSDDGDAISTDYLYGYRAPLTSEAPYTGSFGDDSFYAANAAATVIEGSGGIDTVSANTQYAHRISTFAGADIVTTGGGNDIVNTGDGNDTVNTNGGNDIVDAGSGDDYVEAGAGKDTVNAGYGSDFVDGGTEDDFINASAPLPSDPALLAAHYDRSDRNVILGDGGNDSLYGGSHEGQDAVTSLYGGDSLDGGPGEDWLDGRKGGDTLIGNTGADTLDGGPGVDEMYGDLNSTVTAGSGSDTFNYTGGVDGADSIIDGGGTSADYVPGAGSTSVGDAVFITAADFKARSDQIEADSQASNYSSYNSAAYPANALAVNVQRVNSARVTVDINGLVVGLERIEVLDFKSDAFIVPKVLEYIDTDADSIPDSVVVKEYDPVAFAAVDDFVFGDLSNTSLREINVGLGACLPLGDAVVSIPIEASPTKRFIYDSSSRYLSAEKMDPATSTWVADASAFAGYVDSSYDPVAGQYSDSFTTTNGVDRVEILVDGNDTVVGGVNEDNGSINKGFYDVAQKISNSQIEIVGVAFAGGTVEVKSATLQAQNYDAYKNGQSDVNLKVPALSDAFALPASDGYADSVFIEGTSDVDKFTISTTSVAADAATQVSGVRDVYVNRLNESGDAQFPQFKITGASDLDILTVDGGDETTVGIDGHIAGDTISAEAVNGIAGVGDPFIKLYLVGGGGDDHIIGSAFGDTISAGAGFDTVTGGRGVDVFVGDSLSLFQDELVEEHQANFEVRPDGFGDYLFTVDYQEFVGGSVPDQAPALRTALSGDFPQSDLAGGGQASTPGFTVIKVPVDSRAVTSPDGIAYWSHYSLVVTYVDSDGLLQVLDGFKLTGEPTVHPEETNLFTLNGLEYDGAVLTDSTLGAVLPSGASVEFVDDRVTDNQQSTSAKEVEVLPYGLFGNLNLRAPAGDFTNLFRVEQWRGHFDAYGDPSFNTGFVELDGGRGSDVYLISSWNTGASYSIDDSSDPTDSDFLFAYALGGAPGFPVSRLLVNAGYGVSGEESVVSDAELPTSGQISFTNVAYDVLPGSSSFEHWGVADVALRTGDGNDSFSVADVGASYEIYGQGGEDRFDIGLVAEGDSTFTKWQLEKVSSDATPIVYEASLAAPIDELDSLTTLELALSSLTAGEVADIQAHIQSSPGADSAVIDGTGTGGSKTFFVEVKSSGQAVGEVMSFTGINVVGSVIVLDGIQRHANYSLPFSFEISDTVVTFLWFSEDASVEGDYVTGLLIQELTNGASFVSSFYGGDGDDVFQVYRNKVEISLYGEDGNDDFAVFANLEFDKTQTIFDGVGLLNVQYSFNAPVNVNGGAGYDRLTIVGTGIGDEFIVTTELVWELDGNGDLVLDGNGYPIPVMDLVYGGQKVKQVVLGAGVQPNAVSIESIALYGGDGPDKFYVYGIAPGVDFSIDGGNGADEIYIGYGDKTLEGVFEGYSLEAKPRSITPPRKVIDWTPVTVQGESYYDPTYADPNNWTIPEPHVVLEPVYDDPVPYPVYPPTFEGGGDSYGPESVAANKNLADIVQGYLTVSGGTGTGFDLLRIDNSGAVPATGAGYVYGNGAIGFGMDPKRDTDHPGYGMTSPAIDFATDTDGVQYFDLIEVVMPSIGEQTVVLDIARSVPDTTDYLVAESLLGLAVQGSVYYDKIHVKSMRGDVALDLGDGALGAYPDSVFVGYDPLNPFDEDGSSFGNDDTSKLGVMTGLLTVTGPSVSDGSDLHIAVSDVVNDSGTHSRLDWEFSLNEDATATVLSGTIVNLVYSGADLFNLDLGPNEDRVFIQGLLNRTEIHTGDGDDVIAVSSEAKSANASDSHALAQSLEPDLTSGVFPNLDQIRDHGLYIDPGTGVNGLYVSDSGSSDVTYLDLGDSSGGDGFVEMQWSKPDAPLSAGKLFYKAIPASANDLNDGSHIWGQGVVFSAGFNDDHAVIHSESTYMAHEIVRLGGGDDTYTAVAPLLPDGSFYGWVGVDGQDGLDLIDASLQSVPLRAFGGALNDAIIGTQHRDTIYGGGADDSIDSGAENDVVYGDTTRGLDALGDEIGSFDASLGDDTIYSRSGDDSIMSGDGADIVYAGPGDDFVIGDFGTIEGYEDYSIAKIEPSASPNFDVLYGGEGSDVIIGGGGADHIYGDGDLDSGLTGDDAVLGDYGSISRSIAGTEFYIQSSGDAGYNDIVRLGLGNDAVVAGLGLDTAYGDGGNDVILGDGGSIVKTAAGLTATTDETDGAVDDLHGEGGDDWILGGAGGDQIDAGDDDDAVLGDYGMISANVDGTVFSMVGGGGIGHDDVIFLGAGDDYLIAGLGDDIAHGDAGPGAIVDGSDVMYGDEAEITVTSSGLDSRTDGVEGGADSLFGGLGDHKDVIVGGGSRDSIYGDGGADILLGDFGSYRNQDAEYVATSDSDYGEDDRIYGNEGADLVFGGFGRDTVYGDEGEDVLAGDFGTARLEGGVLVDLRLRGQDGGDDDSIRGGDGADIIYGGFGADDLWGDLGNDQLFGDFGWLTLMGGITTVSGFDPLAPVDSYVIGGADVLHGNAGDDVLVGGYATDVLYGDESIQELGDDVIFGDFGEITWSGASMLSFRSVHAAGGDSDLAYGSAGDDTILGGAAADFVYGEEGEDVLFGDHGEVTSVPGGSEVQSSHEALGGADYLYGGASHDLLIGGADSDTLTDLEGNNVLIGDGGWAKLAGGAPLMAWDAKVYEAGTKADGIGDDDTLTSGDLDDVLLGGAGDDLLNAGEGENYLAGDYATWSLSNGVVDFSSPESSVEGTTGHDDLLVSGTGRDILIGGIGSDELQPGEGDDVLIGDRGYTHEDGSDLVASGSAALDGLEAGGNDELYAGIGEDILIGGVGDDLLDDVSGRSIMLGDIGTVTVDGSGLTIETERPGEGGDDTLRPVNERNLLVGGFGDDDIIGGSELDVIIGDGAYIMVTSALGAAFGGFGVSGNLTVARTQDPGYGGDDLIKGLAGADLLMGGRGADVIEGAEGRNVIVGDYAEAKNYTEGAQAEISTTSMDPSETEGGNEDVLSGGPDRDLIFGGLSSDEISGGGDRDLLVGDQGVATWNAQEVNFLATSEHAVGGDDVIYGGEERDTIFGGSASDEIYGEAADDLLVGDSASIQAPFGNSSLTSSISALGGRDTILGGDANDIAYGGPAGDVIWGNAGSDTAYGEAGPDILFGDEGDYSKSEDGGDASLTQASASGDVDHLEGNGGDDVIFGGEASDVIYGGSNHLSDEADGADVILGDYGSVTRQDDIVIAAMTVSTDGAGDLIFGNEGDDIVLAGAGTDTVSGGTEADVLIGDHGSLTRSMNGHLTSFISTDLLAGASDDLDGDDGDDTVVGGTGPDNISGGADGDYLFGDHAALSRIEAGLIAELWTIAPDLGAVDMILGGTGDDRIFGGWGSDDLHGGDGADLIFGDFGWSRETTLSLHVLGTDVLYEEFAATDPAYGAGEEIYGDSGPDTIIGGAGMDTLYGGSNGPLVTQDHDVLFGDFGMVERTTLGDAVNATIFSDFGAADMIYGGVGNDNIFGGAATDTLYGGPQSDVILGDFGRIELGVGRTRNNMASSSFEMGSPDSIFGDGGNDVMAGGAGSDTAWGDAGDDVLIGDHGSASWVDGALSSARTTGLNFGWDDLLMGETGNDALLGGEGDDVLLAGVGRDYLMGDHGSFNFFSNGTVQEARTDHATLGGDDELRGGDGADHAAGGTGVDSVYGEDGDDYLYGDGAWFSFHSSGIREHVSEWQPRLGSNDEVYGGNGSDSMAGGFGDDVLRGDAGEDIIFGDHFQAFFDDQGELTEIVSSSLSLGGNDDIEGGDGDDILFGSAGADYVKGEAGDDVLFGEHGRLNYTDGILTSMEELPDQGASNGVDTLVGGDGDDQFFADRNDSVHEDDESSGFTAGSGPGGPSRSDTAIRGGSTAGGVLGGINGGPGAGGNGGVGGAAPAGGAGGLGNGGGAAPAAGAGGNQAPVGGVFGGGLGWGNPAAAGGLAPFRGGAPEEVSMGLNAGAAEGDWMVLDAGGDDTTLDELERANDGMGFSSDLLAEIAEKGLVILAETEREI